MPADRQAGKDALLVCDTWEMADALNRRLHNSLTTDGPTAQGPPATRPSASVTSSSAATTTPAFPSPRGGTMSLSSIGAAGLVGQSLDSDIPTIVRVYLL